jgi:hypothetical protein
MVQSLEAKLQEFAAGLTEEESAQVRGFMAEINRGLPPVVRMKARQFMASCTAAETAQLALAARDAAFGRPIDGKADARGYAIGAYDDGFGFKGRNGTNPANAGGGRGPSRGMIGIFAGIGVLLVGGILGGGDLDNL